jgi:pimeloyl-ACP methyl ester carboxylesterase
MDVNESVLIIMHDTGGMVGTAWAAANLARVSGMVITNTVAFALALNPTASGGENVSPYSGTLPV